MNKHKLTRLFPHASKDFIKANLDHPDDTGSSDKPESVDREKVCQTQRSEEMGKQYILRHCEVEFYASHGKQLDQDNKRYIVKPILDAMVNLGLASDDKNITSEVTQTTKGMDKTNPDI